MQQLTACAVALLIIHTTTIPAQLNTTVWDRCDQLAFEKGLDNDQAKPGGSYWCKLKLLADQKDSRLLGSVQIVFPNKTSVAEITRLQVHKEFRSQGIGTRMLTAVINKLRERGCSTIRLQPVPQNIDYIKNPAVVLQRLIAWYKAFGFRFANEQDEKNNYMTLSIPPTAPSRLAYGIGICTAAVATYCLYRKKPLRALTALTAGAISWLVLRKK